jgi:hypothetical protein
MVDLSREIEAAAAWIKKYGKPTYVESVNLTETDVRNVWTERWGENEYITNEYAPNDDDMITGYYITPNQWTSEPRSEVIATAIWAECSSCEAEGEDENGDPCPACDGSGNTVTDLI